MDIERLIKQVLDLLNRMYEFITGSTNNGDVIIDATSSSKSFTGKAKYIVLLTDSQFTAYEVDYHDVLNMRGYNNALIPAKTILNPGKDKFITAFTVDAGGMVQVWQ